MLLVLAILATVGTMGGVVGTLVAEGMSDNPEASVPWKLTLWCLALAALLWLSWWFGW